MSAEIPGGLMTAVNNAMKDGESVLHPENRPTDLREDYKAAFQAAMVFVKKHGKKNTYPEVIHTYSPPKGNPDKFMGGWYLGSNIDHFETSLVRFNLDGRPVALFAETDRYDVRFTEVCIRCSLPTDGAKSVTKTLFKFRTLSLKNWRGQKATTEEVAVALQTIKYMAQALQNPASAT